MVPLDQKLQVSNKETLTNLAQRVGVIQMKNRPTGEKGYAKFSNEGVTVDSDMTVESESPLYSADPQSLICVVISNNVAVILSYAFTKDKRRAIGCDVIKLSGQAQAFSQAFASLVVHGRKIRTCGAIEIEPSSSSTLKKSVHKREPIGSYTNSMKARSNQISKQIKYQIRNSLSEKIRRSSTAEHCHDAVDNAAILSDDVHVERTSRVDAKPDPSVFQTDLEHNDGGYLDVYSTEIGTDSVTDNATDSGADTVVRRNSSTSSLVNPFNHPACFSYDSVDPW